MEAEWRASAWRGWSAWAAGAALLALLSGGCSRTEADRKAPGRIHLAAGFRPGPPEEAAGEWREGRDGREMRTRFDEVGRGLWSDYRIERDDWRSSPDEPGRYRTLRPGVAVRFLQSLGAERADVSVDGTPLPRHSGPHPPSLLSYELLPERIILHVPEGAELPERCVYSVHHDRGHEADGVWRTEVKGVCGDGLTVWPGESADIETEVPWRSALRFQIVCHALAPRGRILFRVKLDNRLVFKHPVQVTPELTIEHHEVELPEAYRARAKLTFEVSGDPAISGIFGPTLGPRDFFRSGTELRAKAQGRPDVILFSVDTFRADNLAAYGGDPSIAPNLNGFADRCLRFVNARSPSVWTLPSHVSLFTGLLPPQHGATSRSTTFSDELVTIAELLRDEGYRTGAITDSGHVTRFFGVDQGFEWFEENALGERSFARTLRSALDFLERDDGRPTFLFVHTYRVHSPYRPTLDESIDAEQELFQRVAERIEGLGRKVPIVDALADFVDDYRALYRGGVSRLDEQLGPWFDTLRRRKFLRRGYFLLTSDHGEEFFEHGGRSHDGPPHEEKIRVPLLVHGPGIVPGDVEHAVSLVDVAPTIAELCGVPPLDVWVGRSLLAVEGERPHFAYNYGVRGGPYLAIVEGRRKVFTTPERDDLEAGVVVEAFDLAEDPGESTDRGDEAWARELVLRYAERWARLDRPEAEPVDVELGATMLEDLRELGYVE